MLTFRTVAALLLTTTMAHAAPSLELGVGKALNNTNSQLPGWVYSGRAVLTHDRLSAEVAYTRMGYSYVADDAALTTLGVSYRHGRVRYGVSEIAQASYSAAVWWDSTTPDRTCGPRECGTRYPNNGTIFSRSCRWCGTVVSAEYSLTKHISLRGEYVGLLHMIPTFQGVMVQVTYRFGS